ncbi:glycosyltransferase [Dorea sp. YH-dor228]|uniref:glycosyltransferase n=1 Tax=Lachnospiraceae TaxID=186803 RepID=UPI002A867C39|nr:glycosyltransferase [Bacilli bacterium]
MRELIGKVTSTLKSEGIVALNKKAFSYVQTRRIERQVREEQVFRDVLFIDGCGSTVPHPARYRITHQREQLAYYDISSNEVFYQHLSIEMVRLYRTFVFFRCPYNDKIGEFIQLAKKLNKTVLFDIDDLVIDTKYTDLIPYLDTMNMQERKQYDDNVRAMGKTLKNCDAAITTTSCLQKELLNYVPQVFVNRNTASEKMEFLSENALKNKVKRQTIDLGYFSGSITHNDDFEMILPVILELLDKYDNLKLHIVGELCVPKELSPYSDKVKCHPFVEWTKLPELIAQVDINLAPLINSVFNEAKSENKWIEAALVQVPTVASNLGAFKECIQNNVTGILCETLEEWNEALVTLIEEPDKREKIALQAYEHCKKNCVSYTNGYGLSQFLKNHCKKNILFVLPSLQISGGVMVAVKHACVLQKKGYDVSLACMNASVNWEKCDGQELPVLMLNRGMIKGSWDIAVATMWTTLSYLLSYEKIKRRLYLVQNYETDFYKAGNELRLKANVTYAVESGVNYITISKWCRKWLNSQFGQNAKYAPNGISFRQFNLGSNEREFKGKIKILIEGDCASYYKNVDESFLITNRLNSENFEIWYLSYNAEPKAWYHVDKFFHKIPYEEVAGIYRKCDILLKTSILESFSYPPLEMMATGGMVVAVQNDGNSEYLVNEDNCLIYEQGCIDDAVQKIERICSEEQLRHKLYLGGIRTAKMRDWSNLENKIVNLYMEEKE